MTGFPRQRHTTTELMNMGVSSTNHSNSHRSNRSSSTGTASTISTFLNPLKKKLSLKKRLKKHGTNALFRAISAENWELVCTIADHKPYKAEAWHNALGFFDAHRSSKILPLHQACIFHPTKAAITHIIQAYPFALQSKESGYGRVPLHIACHSNASIECIQTLVDHYPDAAIEQDIIGRVPLHYALSNGASFEIVALLLGAARNVAGSDGYRILCSVADFNGWLPIHVACFMGASPEVLQLIVEAHPDGIDVKTKKNSTARGLLKGISMNEEKKEVLDSILMNRGNMNLVVGHHRVHSMDTQVLSNSQHSAGSGFRGRYKYASRVSPAKTNMEKVVRMSDETCSMGVTLEINEDETSSLSSLETSRTGLKPSRSTSKRRLAAMESHLENTSDTNSNNKNNMSPNNHHHIPNNSSPGNLKQTLIHHRNLANSLNKTSSSSRVRTATSSPQLPTHNAYEMEEEEKAQLEQEQARIYNSSPVTSNPNRRRNIVTPPKRSISSSARSNVSSDDDDSVKSFQPIHDTAAFC